MDKDLETLINAVAKHLDKLAKRGMYVNRVSADSGWDPEIPSILHLRINVEFKTKRPRDGESS